jgi:hypothetical protein
MCKSFCFFVQKEALPCFCLPCVSQGADLARHRGFATGGVLL